MKAICRFALLVVFFIAVPGLQGGVVQARAPTPSPTATATSTPAPTPTPGRDQFSVFLGDCWLDARFCADKPLSARIDGNLCASVTPADYVGVGPVSVGVPSQQVVPGCGYEGAVVQFFVGDGPTRETGIWHAGSTKIMSFIAGFPFAIFAASSSRATGPGECVVPYIADESCGYDDACTPYGGLGPGNSFSVVVFSNQQQGGCGREGAQITFKLLDAQGRVLAVADQTAAWHAYPESPPNPFLPLTFSPPASIHVGNVGDGPDDGDSPWARLSLALAVLGLASSIGGFALRRRLRPPPIDPV